MYPPGLRTCNSHQLFTRIYSSIVARSCGSILTGACRIQLTANINKQTHPNSERPKGTTMSMVHFTRLLCKQDTSQTYYPPPKFLIPVTTSCETPTCQEHKICTYPCQRRWRRKCIPYLNLTHNCLNDHSIIMLLWNQRKIPSRQQPKINPMKPRFHIMLCVTANISLKTHPIASTVIKALTRVWITSLGHSDSLGTVFYSKYTLWPIRCKYWRQRGLLRRLYDIKLIMSCCCY